MEPKDEKGLSPQAFADLKKIAVEEYGPDISDTEIEQMGKKLLHFFSILPPNTSKPAFEPIKLTDNEVTAINFLHEQVHAGISPSIREFTKVMGFRSSRSGHRLLNELIEKGYIYRDGQGRIRLTERIREEIRCNLKP